MPESTDKPQQKKPQQGTGTKDAARRAAKKAKRQRRAARAQGPTPQWYKYVMFGLMVVGLLWIITFYVTQGLFPLPELGNWNIMIGFAVAITGFLMTLRWRGQ
ncbi:hypothetical protein SCMU_01580 [Sinomonas cyclohexanicum]|uniref:Cell division protein CrgA n=1 Tax=Sinomonas cyclohexanicum TaxID=322009 RepID=A0ABN6FBL2_SINCY|nr:cell division protein CrgA [Corynebacterium cyclohexanicum]BCT74316.1 hypothetical protein SCMU_01580 [Corynebacterium cyclohexanicum]